jgi:pimeloyl-ACP methyl ester carboxylesterase
MAHTVVLVHGAWHGAWCWDKVVSGLAARQVPTIAVELPFDGLDADAAEARKAIGRAGPGAVVVGHSYGGAVISQAASGMKNVGHLVYLCAFMSGETDDMGAMMAKYPSPLVQHMRVVNGRTVVDSAGAVDAFYGDCSKTDTDAALARLRSIPGVTLAGDKPPAWRDVPSTYVVCTEDRAILPGAQREMAAHATHVVEWPTSHSPFVSQPQLVVELLDRLAKA